MLLPQPGTAGQRRRRGGTACLSCALLLLAMFGCRSEVQAGDAQAAPSGTAPLQPWPGVPPLPVMNEVQALAGFVVRNLDDAAEDAAKLALLPGCFQLVSRPLAAFGPTAASQLPAAVGVLVAAASYPAIDLAADAVGDRAAHLQVALKSLPMLIVC